MTTIRKSTTIAAPLEKVWDFYLDPTHLPEIWPSMLEVRDVEQLADGAMHYRWLYKMAGVKLEGEADVAFEPKHRIREQTKGGIESTFLYTFEPEDGRTRVEVELQYEIPVPLVGRLAEPLLARLNEREAELVLANLKDRMEA